MKTLIKIHVNKYTVKSAAFMLTEIYSQGTTYIYHVGETQLCSFQAKKNIKISILLTLIGAHNYGYYSCYGIQSFEGMVLYFFSYKTDILPFQNNPKTLDTSYKMDLDFLDCFEEEKLILQHNFIRPGPRGYNNFSCSTQLNMKFFQLINVKMPTIDSISTFMSRKNNILGLSEADKKAEFLHIFILMSI